MRPIEEMLEEAEMANAESRQRWKPGSLDSTTSWSPKSLNHCESSFIWETSLDSTMKRRILSSDLLSIYRRVNDRSQISQCTMIPVPCIAISK
jgi:hypothetical protein